MADSPPLPASTSPVPSDAPWPPLAASGNPESDEPTVLAADPAVPEASAGLVSWLIVVNGVLEHPNRKHIQSENLNMRHHT